MPISLRTKIHDRPAHDAFRRLRALGADMSPIAKGVAAILENSTRERFETQIAPDGKRWKTSLRAEIKGGRTLTKDGHLGDSITSSYDSDSATVGSNRIYAAIMQEGGEITPKSGAYLVFEIPGVGFISVKRVVITARPYLGLNEDDHQDIEDFALAQLEARLH